MAGDLSKRTLFSRLIALPRFTNALDPTTRRVMITGVSDPRKEGPDAVTF